MHEIGLLEVVDAVARAHHALEVEADAVGRRVVEREHALGVRGGDARAVDAQRRRGCCDQAELDRVPVDARELVRARRASARAGRPRRRPGCSRRSPGSSASARGRTRRGRRRAPRGSRAGPGLRMNWPAGKRRLARCSKNTSSGTRPGTATTCQPVRFVSTSDSRRKSGIRVGADRQVAHAVRRTRRRRGRAAAWSGARTACSTRRARRRCSCPSPGRWSSPGGPGARPPPRRASPLEPRVGRVDATREIEVLLRHAAGVVRAERDAHLVVDIAPLGMVVGLLGGKRHLGHEANARLKSGNTSSRVIASRFSSLIQFAGVGSLFIVSSAPRGASGRARSIRTAP